MSEKDELYNMFKASSELDRGFTPSASSWSRISSILAVAQFANRKKFAYLLPWLILPVLLFGNVFLYLEQEESREEFEELKHLYLHQKHHHKAHHSVKSDTIFKIQNTYIYDTVYIHLQDKNKLESITKLVDRDNRESIKNNINIEKTNESYTIAINKIKTAMQPEVQFVENETHGQNQSKPSSLVEDGTNTTEENNDLSKNPFENEENKNHSADIDGEFGIDTVEEKKLNHRDENPKVNASDERNSKMNHVQKTEENNLASDTLKMATNSGLERTSLKVLKRDSKEKLKPPRVPFKESISKIEPSWGLLFGFGLPEKQKDIRQEVYQIGPELNLKVNEQFQIWGHAAYHLNRITSSSMTSSAWLPPEVQSDTNFRLESTRTNLHYLQLMFGLRYYIPGAKSLHPFFELGYGGHQVFKHKAIYEFENLNQSQDLILERDLNNSRFNINDISVGAGIKLKSERSWNVSFLGRYQLNRNKTLFKHPDYLNFSLVFSWE